MLRILCVLFLCVCGIKAVCYVPNDACTKTVLGLSVARGDCNIQCVKQDDCSAVTYFEENKGKNHVTLSASASPENYVYFNATIKEDNWKIFKVNIYSYDAKISFCRTYTNVNNSKTSANFQLVIFDGTEYKWLENREVFLQYEIELENNKRFYGKLLFKPPSYKRFAKPQAFNMELFNYIDNTEKEVLKLHVQPAEKDYRIPNYLIEVWNNIDTRAERKNFNESTYDLDGFIFYTYNATDKKGTYFFIINPNVTGCGKGNFKTKSGIVDLDPAYTLSAIILYSIFLVLLVFGGSYLCFRNECRK